MEIEKELLLLEINNKISNVKEELRILRERKREIKRMKN